MLLDIFVFLNIGIVVNYLCTSQKSVPKSASTNTGNNMKIEIKLDDIKFCDGCPHIEENWGPGIDDCRLLHLKIEREYEDDPYPRPQACIDKHGE